MLRSGAEFIGPAVFCATVIISIALLNPNNDWLAIVVPHQFLLQSQGVGAPFFSQN
jgi:hypothetical protein